MRSRHLAGISLFAGLAGLAVACAACSDDDLRDQHHGTDAGFGYQLPDGGLGLDAAAADGGGDAASGTDGAGGGGAGDGGASDGGQGDGGAQG